MASNASYHKCKCCCVLQPVVELDWAGGSVDFVVRTYVVQSLAVDTLGSIVLLCIVASIDR